MTRNAWLRISRRAPAPLNNLIRNSLWLVAAAGFSQGAMLVTNLIVANVINVTSFGHYALMQSTVVSLAQLAQVGFGVVIAQQVAKNFRTEPDLAEKIVSTCFVATIAISLVLCGLIFAFRYEIAGGIFRDTSLSSSLVIVSLTFPAVAISNIQLGLFSGLERFNEQSKIALALMIPTILFPSIGAWLFDLAGGLIGLMIVYYIRSIVTQLVLHRINDRVRFVFGLEQFRSIAGLLGRLALPAALGGIISGLAIWGGQTLLARTAEGAQFIGLFAAAFTIKTIVLFVPMQITSALLPLLSRMQNNDRESWRASLLASSAFILVLTGVMSTLGALLAPQIMRLFGPDFVDGASTLRILLFAATLEAVCISLYQGIQGQGRFWASILWVNLPIAIVALALSWWLVPTSGSAGLAWAWVAAWATGLLLAAAVLLFANRRRRSS